MNRYFCILVLLLLSGVGGKDSQTCITIEPHIGELSMGVTQTYDLTQEGLTEFEILTVSLSYADLHIFDDKGDLEYEIGNNIIINRNIYRKVTVFFREPTGSHYTFTVTYWFLTYGAGKPLTGKYVYSIVHVTDSTVVHFVIPLSDITATSRASPTPEIEEREDSTIFSYYLTEDTTIVLTYEPEEGIDYTDTETEAFSSDGHTFDLIYPKKTEVFRDNVESFITTVFPIYLQETGIPLLFDHVVITLDKEEDTWAAAEYTGEGEIRILINNTAAYPSQFLAHELTHSYVGEFPRYLEEGIADYFEGRVASAFAPSLPEGYILNNEAFYQTYERQFHETVDITTTRYGLGLTDRQEALIRARYSKGTHVIYEIASVCGHETVQEMLEILSEKECQVNQLLYELSKGDQVYQILKKYGFDVVPPYVYPAEKLFQEVRGRSWWGELLCSYEGYERRIREASPDDIAGIIADIEKTDTFVSQTGLVVDRIAFLLVLLLCGITLKKVNHRRKENPRILHFGYLVAVGLACALFSYFLYEFLFHGYKFRWIFVNVLAPFGLGILSGLVVTRMLMWFFPQKRKAKYTVEVVWLVVFFGVLVAATYILGFQGILLALGYVVSLAGLFVMRRKE